MVNKIPTLDSIRALDGRNFSMLNDEDLAVLNFYHDQGRKFGVSISITSNADHNELLRASPGQAYEIMRNAQSTVKVILVGQ